MIFPYGVDVPRDHRPVANWLLMAAMAVGFVTNYQGPDYPYMHLTGWDTVRWNPLVWVACTFMHASFLQFLVNMIFLRLFGGAVCSKVGNLLYLPFYVVLALLTGFIHDATGSPEAVCGASAAINGIIGAYLVFFPVNTVMCCYLVYPRPGTFGVPGYWAVVLWLVFDALFAALGWDGVTYLAHPVGLIFGVALAVSMLRTKVVRMDVDELSLVQLLGLAQQPDRVLMNPKPKDFYTSRIKRVDKERDAREIEAAAELAQLRRTMAKNAALGNVWRPPGNTGQGRSHL